MAKTKRRTTKRNRIKRKYSKKIRKTRHKKRVFSKKKRKTKKNKKKIGGFSFLGKKLKIHPPKEDLKLPTFPRPKIPTRNSKYSDYSNDKKNMKPENKYNNNNQLKIVPS